MNTKDEARLVEAVDLLENPSWAARLTNIIGAPLEYAVQGLPKEAQEIISKATMRAINAALDTIDTTKRGPASRWWHRTMVAATGAVGGSCGLVGLPFELPVSTTIMLRSIADIARSEGEDLSDMEAKLACVQVFALGGPKSCDGSSESGYYAARIALARAIGEAAEFIAERGLAEEGAPILARLIMRIAARFEVTVSEKAVAEALPVVGAIGGAGINILFINHFQDTARGHFIVRDLERKHGYDVIRRRYRQIAEAA